MMTSTDKERANDGIMMILMKLVVLLVIMMRLIISYEEEKEKLSRNTIRSPHTHYWIIHI